MTPIKSFTTLEQSRKLAEILPLESADMFYPTNSDWEGKIIGLLDVPLYIGSDGFVDTEMGEIHAWSLAALLEQLKAEIQLENKQILFLHINKYDDINYDIRYTNSWTGEVLIAEADNLVDACVAMIEKLHELKLL